MRLRYFAPVLSAISALSFAAAACSEQPSAGKSADARATAEPAPPIESSALPDDAIATPAAEIAPASQAGRGEAGARAVLSAWVEALERRDFARASELWGKPAEAENFAEYRSIAVSVGEGRIEGAAGSLYYEAPVNFTGVLADGTPIRRSGTIVLRRANDVPGASPEQLRWRIYRTSLQA